MSEWIKCEKGNMPKKGDKVIVCVDFSSDIVPRLIKDAEYTGTTFRIGINTVNSNNDENHDVFVSHWIPIPELP